MDKFYTITIIVAFVILVIALIGLGILLQNSEASTEFPPKQNTCPDNWTVSGGECIFDISHVFIGDLSSTDTSSGLINSISNDYVRPSSGGIIFKDNVLRCDKKKWANKNRIIWDGVTNYNQC
tara:strand:- start:3641 stop:4009 length:369 start_codon:yes stop_codon:yes gene_type:complete